MLRGFINLSFFSLLFFVISTGYSNPSFAQAPPAGTVIQQGPDIPPVIEEGKQYHRFGAGVIADKSVQELITEDFGKIQVIEFFSYDCFWCGRLQPIIHQWAEKKPDNVVFIRIPLTFNKKWEALAKAYYVTKALGKTETLDPIFFKEIHENRIDLSDQKALSDFFVKNGVTEQKFTQLYNSFTINQELARAIKLADAYQISQSPVVIVNGPSGSYSITTKMAGSEKAVTAVVDYLVARESKKLAPS